MATLSENPRGQELEDFVASHLISRGVYVETAVTHRDPEDILELDIVWTDYATDPAVRHPIEIKSGDWSLSDLFKYYGWTQYLKLTPGQYICRRLPGRVSQESLHRLCDQLGIGLIHIEDLATVEDALAPLALRAPATVWLPSLWRFTFWAQRRFRKTLAVAINNHHGEESAKAAKRYEQLINDAVFFETDPRSRVEALFSAHMLHRKLAATMAQEIGNGVVDFEDPPQTRLFERALYHGEYLPVQAALYLAHKGRLAILKAAVDYHVTRDRGLLPEQKIRIFDMEIDIGESQLYGGFVEAVERLAECPSFYRFPLFWQVFLFSWGGFILEDRRDDEYRQLSDETGVAVNDMPTALDAFDLLFRNAAPWFRKPAGDARRVLKLMPAVFRGIGAYRRLGLYGCDEYSELGFTDRTAGRMAGDHNVVVRLLDGNDGDLLR